MGAIADLVETSESARLGIAKAVFEKEVDRVDGGGILVWLGHGWCLVDFDTSIFPAVAGHLNSVRGYREFYRRNVALAPREVLDAESPESESQWEWVAPLAVCTPRINGRFWMLQHFTPFIS